KNAVDFKSQVVQQYGAKADSILQFYPAPNDSMAYVAQLHMSRDLFFGIQQYSWVNIQATANANRPVVQNTSQNFFQVPATPTHVYLYRFARRMPATADFIKY